MSPAGESGQYRAEPGARTLSATPPTPSGREVFEILAREHADMLVAFLRGLVRQDAVDDLFQETMLVAWRRLGEYDRSLPLGPWLRGIAIRLVLNHRRRAGRALLNESPEVLAAVGEEYRTLERTPADSFQQRLDALRGCMDRLPPLLRDVVDLAYGRGMPLRVLAGAIEASEEAVKKRVQRARQLLAECIQSAGGAA